jgi:hypothetical protein
MLTRYGNERKTGNTENTMINTHSEKTTFRSDIIPVVCMKKNKDIALTFIKAA